MSRSRLPAPTPLPPVLMLLPRVLAAGADRDISEVRTELRAHTEALDALREIQLEQSQEMCESFVSQERRIGELEREMQGGFATMATGMAQITALLT